MKPDSWHSYPSIYALGHRAIEGLLNGPVNIEEKVDGSQFSFCKSEDEGLLVRSKGATMHPDAPEKMFLAGVLAVKEILPLLMPGWTYRAEYLRTPKHNTLSYGRIPKHHVIVFDINVGNEGYLPYTAKREESARIGLECVPLLFSGVIADMMEFREFLERESILGGQKVEGVVVKPLGYNIFGLDKKVLMGKFVSESFKEIHGGEWRKANPTSADVLTALSDKYRTPARWNKALLHLQEAGSLDWSPRDIGQLMPAIKEDILKECSDEIKQDLFDWAWDSLQRKVVHGVAEWYKDELLKRQFDQ